MKKALIIIPIIIVLAGATVLGLFAAGIFGKKAEEPVAYAVEASASEPGVFKGLDVDTYFDIRASRDPSTALDNFVIVRDNKGNKVPLKSARQGDGVYRITSRDGFKERATYQIWATGATFVADQYKDLDTFIFMTKGPEKEVVKVNPDIKETKIEGTVVEKIENGDGSVNYNLTLPEVAASRYVEGDIILAKKPADANISEDFNALYTGDIANYAYNGMAAYYVLRTSEVKDGKEEVYCRLAAINEVVTDLDVNKTLTIDESNFTVNEPLLQEALEQSDFTAAVYEAALEAYDLIGGSFDKTVKDNPKMVARFEYEVNTDKIQLNFIFTITLAKGVDVVFAVKNTINITPNVNCDLDIGDADFDLQLDLGVNLKTKTACTIEMDTTDAKLQASDIDDFKKKFKDLVTGKTAEKGIVGAELPIYSYKYPIYCFVLGIEFGVDINLGIKAQIAFEYDYFTDITVGVTYVNGEIGSYKSIETSSKAEDLVILGKLKAEAGVYVKLTASLLEVAGVGFKVKTGAYAEIGGQIRLDMKAALEDKTLHVIKGYYVTGGLYLALGFELKAGITLPVIGWKGWEKYWEPARWEFPLFEYGSKYLVQSLVNDDLTVEVQGKTFDFNDEKNPYKIKVNAFDLDKVADANAIDIGIDAFDVEYIDDAASYITYEDGVVKVNPTVGTEFNAKVKITAKSDNYVTGTITFHKAAVMPTCAVTTLTFDKRNAEDLTFDVKLNQSIFVALTGEGIAENYYELDSDGALTIYKTFLSSLSVGEHAITYVTDKGRVYLTVNVIDSTPITAKGDKTTYTVRKSGKTNAVFDLVLSGSKVTEVEGLKKGEYSVDSAGTLVIYYAAVYANAEEGAYDYVVKANNGTSLPITVTVLDDRQPDLLAREYSFGRNAGVKNDVVIPFTAYNYAVTSVTGAGIQTSNYVATEKSVTIKKDFLDTLSVGVFNFTITFAYGSDRVNETVRVNVVDNATIIAALPAATFDLNDPKDVEYKVFATADITLSGNGVTRDYYTATRTSVTLSAEFMQKFAVGSYQFTASAVASTATLTLEVIDTSVPEIESAEGGVMTITYDKANSGSRYFEMLLAGASFKKVDGAAISADDYNVSTDAYTGATKITIASDYLDSLRVGTYEYSVLTTVNVSTLIIKVVDSRVPEAGTDTSLSYTLGSTGDETRTVTIRNYEHGLKTITVKGGEQISLYSGDCDFDVATGIFTLNKSYLETLTAGYATLFLTFDDEAGTVVSITIAVN